MVLGHVISAALRCSSRSVMARFQRGCDNGCTRTSRRSFASSNNKSASCRNKSRINDRPRDATSLARSPPSPSPRGTQSSSPCPASVSGWEQNNSTRSMCQDKSPTSCRGRFHLSTKTRVANLRWSCRHVRAERNRLGAQDTPSSFISSIRVRDSGRFVLCAQVACKFCIRTVRHFSRTLSVR